MRNDERRHQGRVVSTFSAPWRTQKGLGLCQYCGMSIGVGDWVVNKQIGFWFPYWHKDCV